MAERHAEEADLRRPPRPPAPRPVNALIALGPGPLPGNGSEAEKGPRLPGRRLKVRVVLALTHRGKRTAIIFSPFSILNSLTTDMQPQYLRSGLGIEPETLRVHGLMF